MQNVTQCYYTYVTEYSDGIQEKCVDFYWKTCKIAFKERVFNATTRNCKRPLVKRCDDGGPPLGIELTLILMHVNSIASVVNTFD